jgi:hypothetical protein
MILESLMIILVSSVLPLQPPLTPAYDAIIDIAVENCKNVRPSRLEEARKIARLIYKVELQFNVPPQLKGMVLAAACSESGFNPRVKGDHKFSKKRKPMAIGILQMWPFYVKRFKIDRKDPVQSARAWLQHISNMLPKVKRQCRFKTKKRLWIAAWVTGIRYRKPGGRCHERPKHLRFLKKMHRIYRKLKPIR